ncbi:MAG: glycosyltransferase [Polyangia bacterium]
MPVYNTPKALLSSCIESVRSQIYPHWELCLADDGSRSEETRSCLAHYARLDARIKLVSCAQNRGISHASNLALEQATGEYVALLDHDDELTPDALYWVAETIGRRPDADLLYSDEDKLDASGRPCQPFRKPDWSPELLWNCMYTGHLSVYRTALVRALGGFRSEYDFSQDYDLALRVTETTDQIEHIPRILYHWRQAEGSAAAGGKDFARKSNLAALQAALDRRDLDGRVEALPTANRVRLHRRRLVRVSLIIPTDSEKNLGDSLASIFAKTRYPDLEIVVVTNSALADTMRRRHPARHDIVFCKFDKPFNFSLKCNEGVAAASGEIVVFFNDDVRPLDELWVDELIEYLELPEVGAVSPKLLYENRTIQHAGLVTGVRGLVGTAFHCYPADSVEYFNFVQSVRDASAISGACLAVRKRDFLAVGGFDAENVPINHSDVDLCFRIREHGLRCVYTPYTTLLHIGHLSLREFEKHEEQEEKQKKKKAKDKSDVFLLRRWAGYTGHDPYYTQPMRDLLYRDSAWPWILYGENSRRSYAPGRDALFVSHDLSDSGAPMVLYYAVEHFLRTGGFATVLSPLDGPFRERFRALGVPVIIDSVAFTQAPVLGKLVAGFDLVFANTVDSWPLVRVAEAAGVPTLWYVHESGHIREHTSHECRETLRCARSLWVGSWRALQACRAYNPGARVLEYGVPDIRELRDIREQDAASSAPARSRRAGDKLVISLLGSIEPRKGQDLFVRAIQALPRRDQERAEFNIVGRALVPELESRLAEEVAGLPCVRLRGSVDLAEYRRLILESDVFVCPSRDDTLPLVTLDALAAGKVLVCSDAVGTSAFLQDGVSGFVVPSENVGMLSTRLSALIRDPEPLPAIGQQAREVYLRHFSLPSFTARLDQALRELLGEARVAVPVGEARREAGDAALGARAQRSAS